MLIDVFARARRTSACTHVPRRNVPRARTRALAFALLLCVSACDAARGQSPDESPFEASSSRAARETAIRAMPIDQLSRQDRAAVESVINRACIFRRLPTKVIDCDPDIFTLLAKNPDVVANTWEVLGISKLRMARTGRDSFHADDGNGTQGSLRVLWANYGERARHKILLFSDGTYEGKPFLRPVRARSVILLQSGGLEEANGRHHITTRLDTFVEVEQVGLDLLARTFHPLLGNAADHNFVESMKFVGNFSHTAEYNPAGIERLAMRLKKVSPETRMELVDTAYALADRTRRRADERPANFHERAIEVQTLPARPSGDVARRARPR